MSAVSCRAFGLFVACERAGLIAVPRLLEGSTLCERQLLDPQQRMTWDDWVRLCHRFAELLGSQAAVERAAAIAFAQNLEKLRRLTGRLAGPRYLYWLLTKWVGPSLFHNLQFSMRDMGRQTELTMTIPQPWRACLPWAWIVRGAVMAVPRSLSAPESEVLQATLDERSALVLLKARPSRRAFSVSRLLFGARAAESLVEEIVVEQNELRASVEALLFALHRTDRAETAKAQRRSEKTKQLLLDSLPDLVVRVRRDGVLLDLKVGRDQPEAARLAQFVGGDLNDLVDRHRGSLGAGIARALAGVGVALERGTEVVADMNATVPGGTREYECRMIPLEGDEVICIVRDLTERRRTERRRSADERMIAVGALAAGVAHEVNNPLTYVMANLERAIGVVDASMGREASALKRMLSQALEGSTRVRDVVRSLSLESEGGLAAFRLVDVRAILDGAVEETSEELRGVAQVEQRYSFCPPVYAEPTYLLRLFINLLRNAGKAIASQGDVAEGRIVLRAGPATDGRVEVAVEDNGPAIPMAATRRGFDPFFAAEAVPARAGLGLWVSYRIARDLGGEIRLSSGDNSATFHVLLPVSSAQMTPGFGRETFWRPGRQRSTVRA